MARKYGASDQTLGGKLSPKIALLVGQVLQDHLRNSAKHRADIGTQAAVQFFRTISAERDAHLSGLMEHVLQHDELPDEVLDAVRFAAHHKGEGAALTSLSMVSGITQTTLSQLFQPLLLPAIHKANYDYPRVLLDPSTAAQLAARNFMSVAEAISEGRGSGVQDQRTYRLIELARSRPSPDVLIALRRRGIIDVETFLVEMESQGFTRGRAEQIHDLGTVPLSPEDLALTVLKGIRSEDDARGEAGYSGITHERFRELVLMVGEPLGVEQMAEAYRRGFIDKARLEHGVRQSRVRDEWIDVVEKLRFQRASPADALRGVVQNHLSDAEGKTIAEDGGLDPRDWKWLVETEGNPPGIMQMLSLYNRGDASRAQVEQAIRESRVKDKYIAPILHLSRRLPQERQVINMLSHGTIDEKRGAKLFHELGYDTAIATALTQAATSSQVTKEKALAKSEVEELFYDHAISEGEAAAMLHALGYTPHNAAFLLRLVVLKRNRAMRTAAMAPVRASYEARHINENEAKGALDALGVPHEQRDYELALWTIGRDAKRKSLTEAEIVKANTLRLLSDGAAESRLENLGYTHEDARILLDLEKGRKVPAP